MALYKVDSDTADLTKVAGGTLYADAPVGTISPFGGLTIPNGYLLCNGAEVLKTAYAELYAVIGDAFGTASDSTKFVLPDLRETVPVGSGTRENGVANHDTYDVGEFKDDQLQKHGHTFQQEGGIPPTGVPINSKIIFGGSQTGAQYNTNAIQSISVIDARTGTTTHGKQLGVNYIIKAKQVSVPFDVAEYIRNQNVLSDEETVSFATETMMGYDGVVYASWSLNTGVVAYFKLNGVTYPQGTTNTGHISCAIPFKKGDTLQITNATTTKVAYYKLRDYTGR